MVRCIGLSPRDSERLFDFYRSLSADVTATFQPFEDISRAVLKRHLEETVDGRHISVGMEYQTDIVGHGFVMNIDKYLMNGKIFYIMAYKDSKGEHSLFYFSIKLI